MIQIYSTINQNMLDNPLEPLPDTGEVEAELKPNTQSNSELKQVEFTK